MEKSSHQCTGDTSIKTYSEPINCAYNNSQEDNTYTQRNQNTTNDATPVGPTAIPMIISFNVQIVHNNGMKYTM